MGRCVACLCRRRCLFYFYFFYVLLWKFVSTLLLFKIIAKSIHGGGLPASVDGQRDLGLLFLDMVALCREIIYKTHVLFCKSGWDRSKRVEPDPRARYGINRIGDGKNYFRMS